MLFFYQSASQVLSVIIVMLVELGATKHVNMASLGLAQTHPVPIVGLQHHGQRPALQRCQPAVRLQLCHPPRVKSAKHAQAHRERLSSRLSEWKFENSESNEHLIEFPLLFLFFNMSFFQFLQKHNDCVWVVAGIPGIYIYIFMYI